MDHDRRRADTHACCTTVATSASLVPAPPPAPDGVAVTLLAVLRAPCAQDAAPALDPDTRAAFPEAEGTSPR